MAIFQVVDQDGQKALVEVPVGSDDIWGRYVPGTVPDNPAAIIADLPVGAFVVDDMSATDAGSPAPNTEVWITESGTWTAPVTGWYDVLVIGGGNSGGYYKGTSDHIAYGGDSGGIFARLMQFEQGETVSCTIGAGGVAPVSSPWSVGALGGATVFGEISTDASSRSFRGDTFCVSYTTGNAVSSGGGLGAGRWGDAPVWYGAGGACSCVKNGSPIITGGYQGAVRLRYYDPTKSEGI